MREHAGDRDVRGYWRYGYKRMLDKWMNEDFAVFLCDFYQPLEIIGGCPLASVCLISHFMMQ